jgi:Ran GTPase-activating protein (RanGAP) involved in mRNA processing and transport
MSSYRSLDLSYSGITSECCELLAEGILASTHLQRLSLEGNAIRQTGAKELSRVLWDHECLTELNLSNCDVNDGGAKELADGLLANKRLVKLDLSRNGLGYSGLRAVLYNLAFSPSIKCAPAPFANNTHTHTQSMLTTHTHVGS